MNDQRRQGRIARRGGCRWLGFTFGLRTGGCSERRGERKRGREKERSRRLGRRRGEESPTVRYWRMISCLHSSDPVSNEGEMRAGPIWNNRIPFAIVFLSVSLFLDPTMGTNAYRLLGCVCVRGYKRACSQYVDVRGDGEGEVWRQGSAHLRSRNAVHLWRLGHYAFCPSARYARDFMRPAHTYSIRVHYATSSILVESVVVHRHGAQRQRVVKEIPKFAGTNAVAPCWHRDAVTP